MKEECSDLQILLADKMYNLKKNIWCQKHTSEKLGQADV